MSWQVTQRLDLCSESPRGEEAENSGGVRSRSERKEVLERMVK